MSYSVIVGVFAEVVLKKQIEEVKLYGCKKHGVMPASMTFCPDCGNRAIEWTETKFSYPSFYDLTEDMEDVFSRVGNADLNLPEEKLILFGNMDKPKTNVDTELSEITKDTIDTLTARFHTAYDEYLDNLRPHTESIFVKFGVVTNWY